jgi:phage terminase Nu1 subunit (DNA packaging protein)
MAGQKPAEGVAMATVDVGKVASALNLSRQRVQQLVKEGLPREARGSYDAVKCMLWYVRYLQGLLEKRSDPTPDDGFSGERVERVRLLRAQADLKEMELASQQSSVISVADYDRSLDVMIQTTKAVVMRIAPRAALELTAQTSRVMVQALIEKHCRDALRQLAKPETYKNFGLVVSAKRAG